MKKLLLAVAAVLMVYLGLSAGLVRLFGLGGRRAALVMALLSLLGIGVAALVVYWRARKLKEAGGLEIREEEDELDALVREASAKLAASQVARGAKAANLPVVFLMGTPGTTKTTLMVQSGLEPELLAGQVYQESAVVPTKAANLWFAKQALFVEAGGALLADPPKWQRLLRRVAPGRLRAVMGAGAQSPRAAIVCVGCDVFTQAGAGEALTTLARTLQQRLGEAASTYGVQLPVYVLFTRADRLSFFTEFVRNLSNEEAAQVLGATLPLGRAGAAGTYAEEQARRLDEAFQRLGGSLAEARLRVLPREHDAEKLPGAYEFPREFRKLRGPLVQFLVDLCRPSQLQASPFLRGFYFTGVRPVVVSDLAAPLAAAATPQASSQSFSGATGVFQLGKTPVQKIEPLAAQASAGTKRVPQWVFVSRLFNDVIRQDQAAQAASGASVKASTAQRVLLATAAGIALVLATGFSVSYVNNRALRQQVTNAAAGIAATEAAGGGLPSLDALKRLDSLRLSLEELAGYRKNGAPLSLRWGLYSGDPLYDATRALYFQKFRQLLFGQTQAGLLTFLRGVPASPAAADDYGYAYDTLKGYLITTSNHEKSTEVFLSPLLTRRWAANRSVDGERLALARQQFNFYSNELIAANPYDSTNDGGAVTRARRYLTQFTGTDRVYASILSEASRKAQPVNFNQRFPGSAAVVVEPVEVPGAFSKDGFGFVQGAIRRANDFFGGERWVLGDVVTTGYDPAKLEAELGQRYQAEFLAKWREYVKRASVVRYASLADAAAKLNQLSNAQSPLLALLWLASQNTGVDTPKVMEALQPVHHVVPPASTGSYVTPANTPYVTALAGLQVAIDGASKQTPIDPMAVSGALNAAASARLAAKQLGLGFRPDPEAQLGVAVQKLLEDPITSVEGLVRDLGPAELNGKGKALCGQMSSLTTKFPFNAGATAEVSLAELGSLLKPGTGSFWQFYEANLKAAMPKQGNAYVANPTGMPLNPNFVRYFNEMARFSEALYPNNAAEPKLAYTLKALPSDQVQALTLAIDGTSATLNGAAPPKAFTWPGGGSTRVDGKLAGGSDLNLETRQGLWSVFRFFAAADKFTPSGAGYLLEWSVRQGREDRPVMVGDKPLTYRLQLDTGGAPPVFSKSYLASLRCVSQVAK